LIGMVNVDGNILEHLPCISLEIVQLVNKDRIMDTLKGH
jgi:hypothetical protein